MLITYHLNSALTEEEKAVINQVLFHRDYGMDEYDFDLSPIQDEAFRDMISAYIHACVSYDLNDSYDEQDARRAARAKKNHLFDLINQFLENGQTAESFE